MVGLKVLKQSLSGRYSLISSFHLSVRDWLCFSKSERAQKEASIGDDIGQHQPLR